MLYCGVLSIFKNEGLTNETILTFKILAPDSRTVEKRETEKGVAGEGLINFEMLVCSKCNTENWE